MNKNHIGLHILFALLGLGMSLLFLGLGWQFVLELNREYEFRSQNLNLTWGTICSTIGIVCLILSIGLILRLNWARLAFQILLILGGLAWVAFIAYTANRNPDAWALLIGMGALGVSIAVFGVLFLENYHLYEDLQQDRSRVQEHGDILDQ